MKIIFEDESDEVTFLNMCIAISKVLKQIQKYRNSNGDESLKKFDLTKSSQANLPDSFKYIYIDNKKGECDGQPIYLSEKQKENLKKLLARALNSNQALILSEVKNNSKTITSVLTKLSKSSKIPLSTLKLNAKVLKQLDMIKFTDFSSAELTVFGKFILSVIGGNNPR